MYTIIAVSWRSYQWHASHFWREKLPDSIWVESIEWWWINCSHSPDRVDLSEFLEARSDIIFSGGVVEVPNVHFASWSVWHLEVLQHIRKKQVRTERSNAISIATGIIYDKERVYWPSFQLRWLYWADMPGKQMQLKLTNANVAFLHAIALKIQ